MRSSIQTVGIIGSGPSGATLASLLAMKGVDATLFDDGRRPDLIVGESLIPAIVPVLRKLGLEERAAAICQHKPGVTFTLDESEKIEFCFQSLAGTIMPTYAYNAPRPAFDNLFDQRADELGVKRVKTRAKIERVGVDGLRLAEETLSQAPWLQGRQPDLIVDSTGRTRLFAHALEFPPKSARARTCPISPTTKASRKTSRADRSSSAGSRLAGAGAFRCRDVSPLAW